MEFIHTFLGAVPFEWLQFSFMKNALLAVLLIAPVFALLGCVVVNGQMAFFSDAIGHSALTGIAIGTLMGFGDPRWGMVLFALVLAFGITWLKRSSAASADTIIGLVMSFTVALGIVLLSRGGGFARYSSFLIGDLLSVTVSDIAGLAVIAVVVVGLWTFIFNPIMAVHAHRAIAMSRGVPVTLVESLFAALVAVVVTVCIPWVGLLVINSLLILPAASSRNLARNAGQYVRLSVEIGLVCGVAGLVSSYYWSTATGATIVLFNMGIFLITVLIRKLIGR
jgi:zinc transport system permease protein